MARARRSGAAAERREMRGEDSLLSRFGHVPRIPRPLIQGEIMLVRKDLHFQTVSQQRNCDTCLTFCVAVTEPTRDSRTRANEKYPVGCRVGCRVGTRGKMWGVRDDRIAFIPARRVSRSTTAVCIPPPRPPRLPPTTRSLFGGRKPLLVAVMPLAYSLPTDLSPATVVNASSLLRIVALALISGDAIASRLFAVINFESVIHEL